jgi:hypothetical protein
VKAAARLAEARASRFSAVLERVPERERADVLRALTTLTEAIDDS